MPASGELKKQHNYTVLDNGFFIIILIIFNCSNKRAMMVLDNPPQVSFKKQHHYIDNDNRIYIQYCHQT
jgi:hypothetical protein